MGTVCSEMNGLFKFNFKPLGLGNLACGPVLCFALG